MAFSTISVRSFLKSGLEARIGCSPYSHIKNTTSGNDLFDADQRQMRPPISAVIGFAEVCGIEFLFWGKAPVLRRPRYGETIAVLRRRHASAAARPKRRLPA
jgi:hypothetical protein